MRESLPRLRQEPEPWLPLQRAHPAFRRARCRWMIKGTVDLYAVDVPGNDTKSVRSLGRWVHHVLPVRITPACCTNENRGARHDLAHLITRGLCTKPF